MNDLIHLLSDPASGVTFETIRMLMPGTKTESREVAPGVWEHTFTPDPDMVAMFPLPAGIESKSEEHRG